MQIVGALSSVIVENAMLRENSEVTGWTVGGGWKNGCGRKALEMSDVGED